MTFANLMNNDTIFLFQQLERPNLGNRYRSYDALLL